MEVKEFPTTNVQFASMIDLYIKKLLGENFIAENDKYSETPSSVLMGNTLSYNLKIKKDSIEEQKIEDAIKEYLATLDIACELTSPNQPCWNVYYLIKERRKKLGKFNMDVYPGSETDYFLITFSILDFG